MGMFEQLIASGSLLASDLLFGWPECRLALAISSSLGVTPSQRGGAEGAVSVKQSSVVRMSMSKQHNHLWDSNYALQRRPTLPQTAGAAQDSWLLWKVWSNLPEAGVDPARAFGRSGPKPTNQQNLQHWNTGREGKQHEGGGGGDGTDEGRMPQLCFHSQELNCLVFFLHVASFLSVLSIIFLLFSFSLHAAKSFCSNSFSSGTAEKGLLLLLHISEVKFFLASHLGFQRIH